MPLFGLFGPPNIEMLRQKRDVVGLLKALDHRDVSIRLSAENALNELGTADVKAIVDAALYASSVDARRWAMGALRKLGRAGVEPIITAAQYEDPFKVAELLGHSGIGAVEVLIAHLEDEDVGVHWWAAVVLGEMEDADAVEPLIAALRDDDEDVREAAAEALGRIGGPEAERALAAHRAGR